ncbi:MAG: hypothetical protein AAGG02_06355 [Cyanobacteria bacterium P01_H01_bin.15]
MTAIADFFFEELGYDVYLPLLHFHGLKDPQGMEGVELEEWKANVNFAITKADERAKEVSIGGLSTDGTLSFDMAVRDSRVNGALYLFSAALDLAFSPGGTFGEIAEELLTTFLVDILDNNLKPMIGENLYRYAHVDLDGARELAFLIKETDELQEQYRRDGDTEILFPKPVFAAHSESDTTAFIKGITKLEDKSILSQFRFYRIPAEVEVSHASLVLKDNIYPRNATPPTKALEDRNPLFADMMSAIKAFAIST